MLIWMTQCICPGRHCIMANVGEASNDTDAERLLAVPLREVVTAAIQSGAINPWCGLCNAPSDTWRYELGLTQFYTLAEAEAVLRPLEREQRAVASTFGDIPRSD